MAHRSRAHLVLDSQKQELHKRKAKFDASVERSRALAADSISRAQAAVADDGGVPTDDLEAQIGRPLHSSQIQQRLEKLSPRLYFEVSKADPSKLGVYMRDSSALPIDPKYKGLRFLFGMERGISPEFSVRHQDSIGAFSRETRGWWTVIYRLAHMGVIDAAQAINAFGRPSQARQRWQETIGGFGC
jgi:hypothetical protein